MSATATSKNVHSLRTWGTDDVCLLMHFERQGARVKVTHEYPMDEHSEHLPLQAARQHWLRMLAMGWERV